MKGRSMLEFRKLELYDIPLVSKYIDKVSSRICDVTIGGIFIWRDLFKAEIALYDDMIFFKVLYLRNQIAFSRPIASDINKAINILSEYTRSNNIPLVMCTLTYDLVDIIKENNTVLKITEERDWFDYLYKSEDLINLIGKKYSSVRNNINVFNKLYPNNKFVVINKDNIDKAIAFFKRTADFLDKSNIIKYEDTHKTLEVLENNDLYKFVGGILFVDDQVVGFSLGEVKDDVFYTHIEKGDVSYKGVYQVLVNRMSKEFCSKITYINREDDSGEEGMRASKLKYRPIKLLEKLTVIINDKK